MVGIRGNVIIVAGCFVMAIRRATFENWHRGRLYAEVDGGGEYAVRKL